MKSKYKNAKCILITPNHKRLKSINLISVFNSFDNHFKLSNPIENNNLLLGLKTGFAYLNEIKRIHIKENSYVFMFDLYKLTEIIFHGWKNLVCETQYVES